MNRITIASISPMSHQINRTYGTFPLRGIVPGTQFFHATAEREQFSRECAIGQEFVVLEIADQTDHKRIVAEDLKIELIPVSIPAQVVADDFLRTERVCFEPGNEGEHEGIFQCAGDTPGEGELIAARSARRAFLVKAVQHGDGIFGRVGARGIEQIPDFCKRAVEELGEQRDWVFQGAAPKVQCEGCGDRVRLLDNGTPPAACPKCGAIMDREKAVKLGLLPPTAPADVVDEAEKKRR